MNEAPKLRLAARPFVAMTLVIAASTPLMTEGAGKDTALGFLVYYGGYAVVSLLAGGPRFPEQHLGLVKVAIACVNAGTFALIASMVRLPIRSKPRGVRWLIAVTLAIIYLALLLAVIRSPWWI